MLGREAEPEELADALGIKTSRLNEIRTAALRPASLDAPMGGDEDSNVLAEVVKDDNARTPYEQLEEKTLLAMLLGTSSRSSARARRDHPAALRPRRPGREDPGGSACSSG